MNGGWNRTSSEVTEYEVPERTERPGGGAPGGSPDAFLELQKSNNE